MAVRTLEIARRKDTASLAFTTVYTVPAGKTLIVKEILLVNLGLTAATQQVQAVRGGVGIFLASETMPAAVTLRRSATWTVLEPGDLLQYRVTSTGAVSFPEWAVYLSGSLLSGVA